ALPGSPTRRVAYLVGQLDVEGQIGCWLVMPQGLRANLPCSTHVLERRLRNESTSGKGVGRAMGKFDNFVLNSNLCESHIGICDFFFTTSLRWWFNIESFTNFMYKKDPTLTAIQVFDEYTRNLSEIETINDIDFNVAKYINTFRKKIVKTEYLKIIGDILIVKISTGASVRKKVTTQTQKKFKIAAEKDKENRKAAVYIDSHNVNDEINSFFQSSPKRQSSDQLFEVVESDEDESAESGYETGEENCDEAPLKINKSAFHEAHNAIPNNAKMRLKSGRIVEDILFNYVKDKDYEEHAHSYIIDCENENIKSLFSEEEWEELILDRLGVPSLPQEIAKELARYGKKSLEELRKIVNTPYLQDGVVYDVQQHYDLEWIQMSVRTLVNLYENMDSPLVRNQYEDWFTVALFGACIDMCMRTAQLGTDVKRTDAPSLASANRKNRNRPKNVRKFIGRKIDGIVYIINRLLEVGAIEAARSFSGESHRKYLNEKFKMPKTLRDMLADHIRAVNYDEEKINKIQVFGILHFGLRIQFTRLWRTGGSITIFHKDPQLYYLDNKFSAEGIKIFLKFLAEVYRCKQIIKNNLDVLNSRGSDDIESGDNDLFNELMGVGRSFTPSPRLVRYFADCWKTPRTDRKPKSKKKRKLKSN
ncbi:20349_t:CDS:2, partial [Dentiscutata erythropus]